ncbi:MAG TPA: hypothetical protein PK596_00905 [Bacteroidales bacterium]|jgi:uncharacterized membrane protein|nr:hypothetical protein [Bacteroidales bacterium]HPA68537.1 hypothetical protein [Bacteroidales bacterium]HPV25611.1 hypothetical protein [Bacteroidales bacterium]
MFKPLAVRFYLGLGAIAIFFIIMEMVVGRLFPSLFNISAAAFLTAGFTLTAFIALLIFFNGYHSDRERSVFMTLIALGLKMVLCFVLALLFFLVFKNKSTGSVVLFFILYLAITVYVVLTFTGVLKKKSDLRNSA